MQPCSCFHKEAISSTWSCYPQVTME
uniref:Uncharacterized protein n=1 Tax=Rhizophora mucronata TaxID=61149 RepID=A0A2P2PCC7_RHIMU